MGLRFRITGLRVEGAFRVHGVQSLGFKVAGCRALGFRVQGYGSKHKGWL